MLVDHLQKLKKECKSLNKLEIQDMFTKMKQIFRGLASMVHKFFDKKTKGSGVTLANKSIPQNEQLAEELHKPIIRKFKKREVYSAFKNNIWAVDLADMQLTL